MGQRECKLGADVLVSQFGVEPFLPMVRGVLVAPNGALWVERFIMPDEKTLVSCYHGRRSMPPLQPSERLLRNRK